MKQSDVDPVARTKLAELARQLAAGHITNDQFEDTLPQSVEVALHEIFYCGLWPLYDDLHEHRLVAKHKLTPEGRAWVARIVLFLRSGLPYRWPRLTGTGAVPIMLLSLITLGWFGRYWRRRLARDGDETVWPFFSQAEYEQALGVACVSQRAACRPTRRSSRRSRLRRARGLAWALCFKNCMTPKNELKVLKQIEAILGDTSAHLRKVRVFVWASRIAGWLGICIAVFLVQRSVVSPIVGVVLATFSGIGVGIAIYGSMALTQWPALKHHINEQSVKGRIQQLET